MRHKNDNKRKTALALVFAIPLFAYLGIIAYLWDSSFIYDEGCYALMMTEFTDNPFMVMPSFTGEYPEWKPPLLIWVYALFHLFLKWLPIPVEMAMRTPSAVFGALSIGLTFLIGERLYNRRTGIYAAVIFACTPLMVFCSVYVMMEALSLFLALGAIHSYLKGNIRVGALLLGLLVLTKSLYGLVPAAFLAVHFWKKKEFRPVILSFLVIPAAYGLYYLLAARFGDLDHAITSSLFYLFRVSAKSPTLRQVAGNMRVALYVAFPLSTLFLVAIVARPRLLIETLPVAVMASVSVITPFFPQFIFWYMSLSLPCLALFSARILEKAGSDRLRALWLVLLIAAGLLLADKHFYWTPYPTGAKEVAEFTKGKKVLFVEPGELQPNWGDTNRNYLGTRAERLVLEQRNPGFLYYRFWNSTDYGSLKVKFLDGAKGTYTPPCSEYLVLHERDRGLKYSYSVDIPGSYGFLWKKGDYAVWKGRADCP